MAKFYGAVGYVEAVTVRPGVSLPEVTERNYKGDLIKNTKKQSDESSVNGGVSVMNDISIVADPYALDHFHKIAYVTLYNSKWTVTHVTVQYPRLVLTLGGIYNGPAKNGPASNS